MKSWNFTALFDFSNKNMFKSRRGTRRATTAIKVKPQTGHRSFEILVTPWCDSLGCKQLVEIFNWRRSTDFFYEGCLLLFLFRCDNLLISLMWVVIIQQWKKTSISRLSEYIITNPSKQAPLCHIFLLVNSFPFTTVNFIVLARYQTIQIKIPEFVTSPWQISKFIFWGLHSSTNFNLIRVFLLIWREFIAVPVILWNLHQVGKIHHSDSDSDAA